MDFTPRATDKTLEDGDGTDNATTEGVEESTLEQRVSTLERELKSLRRKLSTQTRDHETTAGTVDLLQDSVFGTGVRKTLADIEVVREQEDAEAEVNAR